MNCDTDNRGMRLGGMYCSKKGVEAPVKTAVDKFQLLPAFLKVPNATLHRNFLSEKSFVFRNCETDWWICPQLRLNSVLEAVGVSWGEL